MLSVGIILFLVLPAIVSSVEYYDRQTLVRESETCLDCHDDQKVSLAGSAHQLTEGKVDMPMAVGCIGCHDGWKVHLDDPSAETIAGPGSYSFMDQAEVCGRCHQNPHQASQYSSDPHSRTDIGCLSCHKVHNNRNRALVKDDGDNYCGTCHTEVMGQFKRRSVHPLESGNVRCTDCHRPGMIEDNLFTAGIDWICQGCHSELAGPNVYEHSVVYGHLVEGSGCSECHEPHGAANDRLLKQPGNGVCIQCHGVPPLHRTAHVGLGTTLACVDCHTEIHGSDDNSRFLDPDLGSKLFSDCYQSGCHDFAGQGGGR